MNEILSVLYQKNPKMRIVINAISLETICEIKEVLSDYPIENEELIQLQVSGGKSGEFLSSDAGRKSGMDLCI